MNENVENLVAVVEENTQNTQTTAISTPTKPVGDFVSDFRECYQVAKTLCKAKIIPEIYQGKVEDTAVAIDMANRMGVSPMMVMQNLYVVKGKPSWSGQACMSFIRAKFTDVKTIYVGEQGQDSWGCYVKAKDKDGDILQGTTVTIAMAKGEGWYSKKDKYGNETSKWQTIPELMLAYRAAAFFARVHCPEVLMGCQIEGEAEDIVQNETVRTVPDVL